MPRTTNSHQENEDDELSREPSQHNNMSDQSVEMIEFDMFLNFKTKGLTDDFLAFKVQNRSTPLLVLVTIIGILTLVIRGVFFSDVKALVKGNPVFYAYHTYAQSILAVFLAAAMCLAFAPKQLTIMKYLNRTYLNYQFVYDTCLIFAGTVPGIRLVGRVVQGNCAPGTSVWHSQVCNTNGAMNELPMDALMATIIYNIAFQILLRSSTPSALCFTWIVNIFFINVALYLVESPLTLYINLLLLILCMTSYEVERMMMQFYVNQKFALASAEANTILKVELIRAQMNEEKRALDSKREMVRHIAHEIRTPLNIVTVATDIILAELNKIDSVPQFVFDTLNSCQEACAIGCDIVNDLLNFEKLAAGLVTLEKMPMVLSTYVQGVLNPFYVSAGAKNLVLDYQYTVVGNGQELVVDHPENVTDVVEIDSVKMSSVLRNLLSNAIKFAQETIVVKVSVVRKLETHISASEDDQACSSGHAVISVKDDGAGISSGNLSRLFQEGVQFNANELQKGGGSGFGLYIAKGIVDLHTNSRMWAESDGEGKGATFFVKLPLSDVALPSSQRQSVISDAVGVLNATLSPLVILVVDDSPINRRLTIQLLKLICGAKRTCTFIEAVDGQEAVACVTQSLVAPMLHFSYSRPVVRPSEPRSEQSSKHESSVQGSGSKPNSATGSQNPSRRNSFNKHLLAQGGPDLTSHPPSFTSSSADHSSSGRGYRGLNKSDKGRGMPRSLNTSWKCGLSTSVLAERRNPVVQIDIIFMDYNMPRMVRIITIPSILAPDFFLLLVDCFVLFLCRLDLWPLPKCVDGGILDPSSGCLETPMFLRSSKLAPMLR